MIKQHLALVAVGSVSVGATFTFRTVDILGMEYADARKPPYEGEVLTVVEFKPQYKNNVVVRNSAGMAFLLPLDMVEKALRLSQLRPLPHPQRVTLVRER